MAVTVIENLGPVLIKTFAIVLIGFFSGYTKFMDCEACGVLGAFLGKVALPALLFVGMSALDWDVVQWSFLGGVIMGKTVMFLLVAGMTYRLYGKDKIALARGGLYGLFATQSNDFALGLPVIKGVFQAAHPSFITFFYLTGPTQVAWINPIAFAMLEAGRDLSEEEKEMAARESESTTLSQRRCKWFLKICKSVFFNPIIFCTLGGLLANVIFSGPIPSSIISGQDGILHTLGNAYDALALFTLGLSMATPNLPSYTPASFKVAVFLIGCKLILDPLITMIFVLLLGQGNPEIESLSLYGFLYGGFPTAPSLFVFAQTYNIDVDSMPRTLILCTFLSAPIMFVSAIMATRPGTTIAAYNAMVVDKGLMVGYFSTAGALWVLLPLVYYHMRALLSSKSEGDSGAGGENDAIEMSEVGRSSPDADVNADPGFKESTAALWSQVTPSELKSALKTTRLLPFVALTQCTYPLGSLWCGPANNPDVLPGFPDFLRFLLIFGGIIANRIWLGNVALELVRRARAAYLSPDGDASASDSPLWMVMLCGWGVPLLLCVILNLVVEAPSASNQCWYKYGFSQFVAAAVVVVSMFTLCIWSLIRVHGFRRKQQIAADSKGKERAASASELVDEEKKQTRASLTASDSLAAVTDSASLEAGGEGDDAGGAHADGPQVNHTGASATWGGSVNYASRMEGAVLWNVLSSCIGMFVIIDGLLHTDVSDNVHKTDPATGSVGGIYIEIAFLDAVCNYGSGVVTFFLFGMTPVVTNFYRDIGTFIYRSIGMADYTSLMMNPAAVNGNYAVTFTKQQFGYGIKQFDWERTSPSTAAGTLHRRAGKGNADESERESEVGTTRGVSRSVHEY